MIISDLYLANRGGGTGHILPEAKAHPASACRLHGWLWCACLQMGLMVLPAGRSTAHHSLFLRQSGPSAARSGRRQQSLCLSVFLHRLFLYLNVFIFSQPVRKMLLQDIVCLRCNIRTTSGCILIEIGMAPSGSARIQIAFLIADHHRSG